MSFQHSPGIQPATQEFEQSRASTRPRRKEQKYLVPWEWKGRVVVIEDELEMRSVVCWALRREGYQVVPFSNCEDALIWIGPGLMDGVPDRLPSAIVCDIRIPNFSGLELLETLDLAGKRIPTIMITGFPDDRTRAQALQLGAICVLEKPFALDVLCTAVRRAVGDRLD